MKRVTRLTHEERHLRRLDMANKVRAGLSVEVVANEYGVGTATVERACRQHQVTKVHNAKIKTPIKNLSSFEILAALMRNEQPSKIAERFNVSRQRVDQIRVQAIRAKIPGFPSKE